MLVGKELKLFKALKIFIIVFLFFIILFLEVSAAADITVGIKESFERGELIYFDYIIIPEENKTVVYSPFIICEEGSNSSISWRRTRGKTSGTFIWRRLAKAQPCQAKVLVKRSPTEESKKFEVVANDPFVFEPVILCKYGSCSGVVRDSVFEINSPARVEYVVENRSVPPLDRISVNLIHPDNGSTQYSSLPVTFTPKTEGVYTLEVKAYRGDEVASDRKSFAVGKIPAEEERESPLKWIVLAVGGVLAVIVIYLIYRKWKSKKEVEEIRPRLRK